MTRDLRRVWPLLDYSRLDQTYGPWSDSVENVVRRYERESLERTSKYMDDFYAHERIGDAPLMPLITLPEERFHASLHSTSVAGAKKATALGVSPQITMSKSFVKSSQAMTRFIRDAAREQVRVTSLSDNRLGAWERVGTGDTCGFCLMLISRGAVYSKGSVRFASHTNCNCEVQPAHSYEAKPVDEYRKSDRTIVFDDKQKQANKDRIAHYLELHELG